MALARPLPAAAFVLLLAFLAASAGAPGPAGAAPARAKASPSPSPSPAKKKTALMTQAEAEKIGLKEAGKLHYDNPKLDGVKWTEEPPQWKVNVRGTVEGQPAKLELRLDAREGTVVEMEDERPGHDDREGKRRRGGRDVD